MTSRIPAPVVNSRWRDRATDSLYKVVAFSQPTQTVIIAPLGTKPHETEQLVSVPLLEWAEKYAIADIY